MTIPEEIEQLKIKLEKTTDNKEQAEVLLEILKKLSFVRNTDAHPYIDRLVLLADKIGTLDYKTWGIHHLGNSSRMKGEYNAALDLTRQALSQFKELRNNHGIADTYNIIGKIYAVQANYPEALKNHFAALKLKEETGDSSGIAVSYDNIGKVFFYQGNYSEALTNHLAALKLYEQTCDKHGSAISYINIGDTYYRKGNYSETLRNYFTSLKLREQLGDKQGIADAYNNLGTAYDQQGNYPEALRNYVTSLKLREQIGDNWGTADSYLGIGVVYSRQENYSEALKNYLSALKIKEQISHDKRGLTILYNNIGSAYLGQRNYTEALKNYFTSLQLNEELGSKNGVANSYNNIGIVYQEQMEYGKALKNHFSSLKLKKEIGDKHGIASAYNNIGSTYYMRAIQTKANPKNRKRYFRLALKKQLNALQTAEEIGYKLAIKETVLSLTNIYKATHDFENALKYFEKYHGTEKEMLGEESTKQLNNLNFMHNMEQKEKDLEIEQLRNVELKKERDRSESLLLNILPAEVAEELKEKGTANAKHFDNVTVLFTDFKGFTTVSEKLTPQQLVDELHACFSGFDAIISKYNIEKIKTVGDAYLAVSGLPLANANHAEDMVKAAIEIRDFIANRKKESDAKVPFGGLGAAFEVRIGIHSGSVVAGIVGVKKFAYDIWGDTVNTAARMEQNSEAGKINISQTTYELVKDKFECQYRGEIAAKNKGKLKMYFVN